MPTLSLYYGIVLSLESSPHSSAIRLKLHPSCRPLSREEAVGEDEHGEYDDEVEEEPRYPKYFGEDLDNPAEGDQPDIKEIKLDDVVDCRRISL